jgi:hypothetical protein
MKHPIDKVYTGKLSAGQKYVNRDGSVAYIMEIAKNENGVWCADIIYKYATKKGQQQSFTVPCWDFEKQILNKEWR